MIQSKPHIWDMPGAFKFNRVKVPRDPKQLQLKWFGVKLVKEHTPKVCIARKQRHRPGLIKQVNIDFTVRDYTHQAPIDFDSNLDNSVHLCVRHSLYWTNKRKSSSPLHLKRRIHGVNTHSRAPTPAKLRHTAIFASAGIGAIEPWTPNMGSGVRERGSNK